MLDDILLVLTLLTRLPAGRLLGPHPLPLRDAVWAFPLVGLLVGAAAALTRAALRHLGVPPLLGAGWALAVMVVLTGGLHEDAVADTADAMGGATVERRLAILRDSRIGSFGAAALGVSLLLRVVAMASLTDAALVASVVCGRAAMGVMLALLPPARAEGLGASAGRASLARAGLGVAIAAGVALALLPAPRALVCLAAAALGAAPIVWLAGRRFGGQTGDLCGAAGMAAEILAMTLLTTS